MSVFDVAILGVCVFAMGICVGVLLNMATFNRHWDREMDKLKASSAERERDLDNFQRDFCGTCREREQRQRLRLWQVATAMLDEDDAR